MKIKYMEHNKKTGYSFLEYVRPYTEEKLQGLFRKHEGKGNVFSQISDGHWECERHNKLYTIKIIK